MVAGAAITQLVDAVPGRRGYIHIGAGRPIPTHRKLVVTMTTPVTALSPAVPRAMGTSIVPCISGRFSEAVTSTASAVSEMNPKIPPLASGSVSVRINSPRDSPGANMQTGPQSGRATPTALAFDRLTRSHSQVREVHRVGDRSSMHPTGQSAMTWTVSVTQTTGWAGD